MYIRVNGKIYKVRQDSSGYYYEQSNCTHNKQRVTQGSEMLNEYPHKRLKLKDQKPQLKDQKPLRDQKPLKDQKPESQEIVQLQVDNDRLRMDLQVAQMDNRSLLEEINELRSSFKPQIKQSVQRRQQLQEAQDGELKRAIQASEARNSKIIRDLRATIDTIKSEAESVIRHLTAKIVKHEGIIAEQEQIIQEVNQDLVVVMKENDELKLKLKFKKQPKQIKQTQQTEEKVDTEAQIRTLTNDLRRARQSVGDLTAEYDTLSAEYQAAYKELLDLRRRNTK